MALSVTASPTSLAQAAGIDDSKYDTIQTINYYAKNANQLVTNTRVDPVLRFDTFMNSPTYQNDYFSAVNNLINPRGYTVLRHDNNVLYIAVNLFDSREFDVLYLSNTATLDDTIANFSPANNRDYFIGGNGPFFDDKSGATPWPVLGTVQSIGNPGVTSYPAETFANSLASVEWFPTDQGTPPRHLVFQNAGHQAGAGTEGLSNLPYFLWQNQINTINPPGSSGASEHMVAYNVNRDMLFIIGYRYGDASFDLPTLSSQLQALGFDYGVFFDSGTSLFLWEYTGKGKGIPILIDDFFYRNQGINTVINKNQGLHIAYGLKTVITE